jgi:drug/metabolite transporter (DMT)-like permease
VIALSLLVTTIVYTPAGIIDLPSRFPPGRVVASIATLAVVCTAAAFLIFFELIAEVGPVRATVITFVNPAVAVLLGVALLGEAFTVATGLGFVLVLGGSVLSTRGNRQAQAEPAYTEPVAGVAPGLGSEVQTSSQVSIAIADPSPAPDGWRPTGGSAG